MPVASAPNALRFEHHPTGAPLLGIGTSSPRLSWLVEAADTGYVQGSYEVEVIREGRAPQAVAVAARDQILVPWPVEPLTSRERAVVRVRVRDAGATEGVQAAWSPWSERTVVEAGLLRQEDWTARFVSPRTLGNLDMPAPVLRGVVALPDDVVRGRLYATAHGIYAASLNGHRVGEEELAPGWTSYRRRLRYQTHDVTELLRGGENVLEVLLGNGWYRSRIGFAEGRALYGDRLSLLAQLEVTICDGTIRVLSTDGSWTARNSAVVSNDLYDGQRTDLRLAGGDVGQEADAVDVVSGDLSRLVAPEGPPARVTDVLPAVKFLPALSQATIVDFGQNVVGWVRLRIRGMDAGREVVVRHAEVLESGELGVRPLRTAKATDSYVLAGRDEQVLEPNLTFHGFRYAEVTGVLDLRAEDLEAVVVGTDLRRTGWFNSSHRLLDRFHENVVWGMRGNFLHVPTDCPQRDERLGWTGDIQIFSPTANFLFDSAGFLASWLADLAADQQQDGSVPFVVPDVLRHSSPAAAAWGDAATVVPWVVYRRTGDLELLRRQLPSMRAWVDCITRLAGSNLVWSGGFQFGDWLDPTASPDDPSAAQVDPDVIATAHLARSAEIVAWSAEELGDDRTARQYRELATAARVAFAHEYVTPGGRVVSDAQTAYALAIEWQLLPSAEQRSRAALRMADLVRSSGFRIGTGFVGTPLIADALTAAGHAALAYRLLLQTRCPSWLYPVTMGATTVWERWDSMLPDGSINPGEMTSFNHYALGAVADWLHRTVAGLAPAAPGYREILVRPLPGGGLTFASARHLTPYGEAAVAWHRDGGLLTLHVRVPVGSRATVHIPGEAAPVVVLHGDHVWEAVDRSDGVTAPSADAPIRTLMDHEPTWNEVVEASTESGFADDDRAIAERLQPYLDHPSTELGRILCAGDSATGAFRQRLDKVLSRLVK